MSQYEELVERLAKQRGITKEQAEKHPIMEVLRGFEETQKERLERMV